MGKASYRQIGGPEGLLNDHQPFEGNTMRGSVQRGQDCSLEYLSHCGRLYMHPDVQEQMRQEHKQGFYAMYVVWSYNTPIAYVRNDGKVVVMDAKYSSTTTRQQNLCRAWL